jgi:hypothetical protein
MCKVVYRALGRKKAVVMYDLLRLLARAAADMVPMSGVLCKRSGDTGNSSHGHLQAPLTLIISPQKTAYHHQEYFTCEASIICSMKQAQELRVHVGPTGFSRKSELEEECICSKIQVDFQVDFLTCRSIHKLPASR